MSGVYIPNLKMPSGCVDCPLNYDATCNVIPFGRPDETNGTRRRDDCPLILVPDYDELLRAARAMHTWIFLNSVDEYEAYEECGLSDEMDAILGYAGSFMVESADKEGDR